MRRTLESISIDGSIGRWTDHWKGDQSTYKYVGIRSSRLLKIEFGYVIP